jgi:DNA topoisomerase-1
VVLAMTLADADQLDALDLVWVDDSVPGLRRRRCGRSFTYLRPSGRVLRDAEDRERIRALAIPPAWEDVWICADPNGHLQATGRDARGRKQYRYHPRFREHRDSIKFERLYDFGEALPSIRRQVAHDLTQPGLSRDKVVATVVRLLEATLIRVGNEEYARDNQSYGLTTLRDKHARFDHHGFRFVFRAKSGIDCEVTVDDPRLRRIVKRCQDLPGQVLFQYLDDDGSPRPVTSTDVNDYLRDAAGIAVTAKDFRTWMGTLLCASTLATLPPPASPTEGKRVLKAALEEVAEQLRNTPAVSRGSYVHPRVIETYEDGTLPRRWAAGPSRAARQLVADERRLLALLKPRARARRAAAEAA